MLQDPPNSLECKLIPWCGFIPWLPRAGTVGENWTVPMRDWSILKALMLFCLESFLQERWKQFPSLSISNQVSVNSSWKENAWEIKCGKGGISGADIPVWSSLFAKSRQTWMLFFQFSVKSFVFLLQFTLQEAPCVAEVLFILHSLPGQQELLPSASFICFCNNKALPCSFCGYFFWSFFLLPCWRQINAWPGHGLAKIFFKIVFFI